jgi:hypothetical protein
MKAQGNPDPGRAGRHPSANIFPLDFRPWSNGGYGFFLLGLPSVVLAKGVLNHGFFQPPGACPGTSTRTDLYGAHEMAETGEENNPFCH